MPEIELPPSKYRWRRPLSKPLAWGFVAVGLVMLGYFFWTRDDGSTTSLFFATALIAACVGGLVANLLKDID